MERKETIYLFLLIVLFNGSNVLMTRAVAGSVWRGGSGGFDALAERAPQWAEDSGELRRYGKRMLRDQINLMVIRTTEAEESVIRALDEAGYAYEEHYEPDDWTGLDFSSFDVVLIAMHDGGIDQDDISSIRNEVIDAGKRVIFIGGCSTQDFVNAVNTSLLGVSTISYDWHASPAPHFIITNQDHPLVSGLESPRTFNNAWASSYCIRITEPELIQAAENGEGAPVLIYKGDYGTGGDLIWITNDPDEIVWENQQDFDVLKRLIGNSLQFGNQAPLLLLTTTSLEESVEDGLQNLGFVYTKVFAEDWTLTDFEEYEVVIAAMDGGEISEASVQAVREDVIEQGKRLIFIGGTSVESFVLGVNEYLTLVDTQNYSWSLPPADQFRLTNASHFLSVDLPNIYNFENSFAGMYQIRIRQYNVQEAARNGHNEICLYYQLGFSGGGDFVWFVNSPLSYYWENEEDRDILKQVLKNSLSCLNTGGGCDIALVSDEDQLNTLEPLLDNMGITYDRYNDNGNETFTAQPDVMSNYEVCIWYQYDRGISTDEKNVMDAWVMNGGRLLVTGFDSLGSPDDLLMAQIVRSEETGDGPFDLAYTVITSTHPIINGPYGQWSVSTELRAGHSDHDKAVPDIAEGAVSVADFSDGTSKIMATDSISLGGKVVYWNGNYELKDWTNSGTQPDQIQLLKNTLFWLCQAPETPLPSATPTWTVTSTPEPTSTPTITPTPFPIPSLKIPGFSILILLTSLLMLTGTLRKNRKENET